jgi:hypothetical protein
MILKGLSNFYFKPNLITFFYQLNNTQPPRERQGDGRYHVVNDVYIIACQSNYL